MLKFPPTETIDGFTVQRSNGALKLADRIEYNIALLAFYRGVDSGAAKYNLVGGFIDDYVDQTGVNAGSSTGYTFNVSDSSFQTSLNQGGIDTYTKLLVGNNVASGQVKAIAFDGTGDYLSLADHADWDFGTGDFTLECWANFASFSASHALIEDQYTGGGFELDAANDNTLRVYLANTLPFSQSVGTWALNCWYHIAVSRSGTNLRVFLNGVQLGSTVTNSTSISVTGTLYIGIEAGSALPMNGYMKEIRISNIARYTANFTPTTTLFTADSNTKLLIHGEEAVGAVTFADSETSPKTVTTAGDCKIKLTSPLMERIFLDTEITAKTVTAVGAAKQIPYMFNKSAAFFNGTTDYLVVPDSPDWDFGTGDFTLETWVNFRVKQQAYCINRGSNNDLAILFEYSSGVTSCHIMSTTPVIQAAWVPDVNTWYHIAFVRSGTSCVFYVDGLSKGTGTSSGNITSANPIYIGNYTGASVYLNGWLKELRISNSARYTATFTPSTSQFTTDSNTKLLLHFDTPATAPLSPAIYMDGTGDNLTLADHADWKTGSGDFTYEMWVKWDVYQFSSFFNWMGTGTIQFAHSNSLLRFGTTAYNIINYSWTPTVKVWYHLAWQYRSGNCSIWINGQRCGAEVAYALNISGSATMCIGSYTSTSDYFYGWMKEIRISNVARYGTTSFTPSQTPFVADSNTKLLIHGAEANGAVTFYDSETSPKTITTVADTKIKYTEDYRNTIFIDSETTPKYPYPSGAAKIDFIAPFGTGAGFFDGSTGYLQLANTADYDMGTGDYTVSAWMRVSSISAGYQVIMGHSSGTSYALQVQVNNAQIWFSSSSSTSTTFAFVFATNTWYYIEIARSSGSVKAFVNGTQVGSTWSDATNMSGGGYPFKVGVHNGQWMNGLLDNVKVDKGIARHSATFDPPTEELHTDFRENMTLQSIGFQAATTPSYERITIFEEDIDSVIINTDLMCQVSRDNGVTWKSVTLALQGTWGASKNVYGGIADMTLTPTASPYNCVYKITTANNKNLKLHGAGMNW